jgi:hypothetical protein
MKNAPRAPPSHVSPSVHPTLMTPAKFRELRPSGQNQVLRHFFPSAHLQPSMYGTGNARCGFHGPQPLWLCPEQGPVATPPSSSSHLLACLLSRGKATSTNLRTHPKHTKANSPDRPCLGDDSPSCFLGRTGLRPSPFANKRRCCSFCLHPSLCDRATRHHHRTKHNTIAPMHI